jgi:hypothetical protein
MKIFFLLNSLLFPSAVGVLITRILLPSKKLSVFMLWMIGYGLGMGLLAQFMLILGILKVHYSLYSISLPFLLLFLILLFFQLKKRKHHQQNLICSENIKLSVLDYLLMGYIIFQVVFVFWHTYFIPVYEWDVIATHSFNAKILFFEKSLVFHPNFPHREYPLQIPFLEAWVAFNLGQWDDQMIKAIFFPMFLSFIGLFYYFFKSRMNHRWALLAIVFLLSSNLLLHHAASGYREFTLAYYNTTVFLFLLFWHRYRDLGWLILAGLFSGFCSFIKLEGLGYILMHVICLFVLLMHDADFSFFKKITTLFRFVMLSLGMASVYLIYKMIAFPPDMAAEKILDGGNFGYHSINIIFSMESFPRILTVLKYFLEDLFLLWNWNLIWFLVVLSLPKILHTQYKVEVRALLWSLLGFFGVYLFGFSLTQHYFWATNYQAVSRAFLHFFPLRVMLIVFFNYPSFFNFDSND